MKDKDIRFQHGESDCIGILLTNLGTPDSPEPADVRRYLKEFLWDSRVVEVPRPIWWFVLNLIILNSRPKKSAEAYSKVWTDEGSPLLTISRRQEQALQVSLDCRNDYPIKVELAMRYGNPSIAEGLEKLRRAGARKILVLPLYPQYSATTTASTFDAVTAELKQWRWVPELRFINHYHDEQDYINVLAASIRGHWEQNGQPEKLVLSFHGIPKAYFHDGDPYYCECHKTSRLLADTLGLNEDQWVMTFQSRLGPKEWLTPYTDKTLKKLGKEGIKNVHIVCPGFSTDCLETLEEVAMENREYFFEAGGENYEYIPCLNDGAGHIEMLAGLVMRHLQGWIPAITAEQKKQSEQLRAELASADGADH
jgi:ferrochelatase